MAYGAQTVEGRWSYEIVVLTQFVFVLVLMIGYPFFPESPYYLLKNKNEERARKMLQRIHGNGMPELINAEIIRMNESIAISQVLEKEAKMDGPLILQCFKGTNLVRQQGLRLCYHMK